MSVHTYVDEYHFLPWPAPSHPSSILLHPSSVFRAGIWRLFWNSQDGVKYSSTRCIEGYRDLFSAHANNVCNLLQTQIPASAADTSDLHLTPHRPTHSIISWLSSHCFNSSLQILKCWRERLFLLWSLQVALQFPDQLLYAATRVVAKLKVYANFLLLLACLNVQCANCPFKFFATIVLWATS